MNNYGKSKKTFKIIVNLVNLSCVISRFHSSVKEICILLGFYTAENGCLLSTFQDNLSVPSLMVQQINIFLFGLPSSRSAINKIHFMTHKLKTILKIWPKAYIQKSKCHSLMVNYQLQSWLHTICWCTYLYDLSVPDLKSAAEVQSIIQGIVFTTLIKKDTIVKRIAIDHIHHKTFELLGMKCLMQCDGQHGNGPMGKNQQRVSPGHSFILHQLNILHQWTTLTL